MDQRIQKFVEPFLRKDLPEIRPGDKIRVYQKIKEVVEKEKGKKEEKQKTQIFEGIVLARKHGKGIEGTFTVRGMVAGVWVEKTFPLHSPLIEKIEILERYRVKRAKLYYLREKSEKEIKRKLKPIKK